MCDVGSTGPQPPSSSTTVGPDEMEARESSPVARRTSRSAVVIHEPEGSGAFSIGTLDRLSRRVHLINISINLALLFAKSYVFFQTSSNAILASLVDSAVDLLGQGMLLWCARSARRPRDATSALRGDALGARARGASAAGTDEPAAHANVRDLRCPHPIPPLYSGPTAPPSSTEKWSTRLTRRAARASSRLPWLCAPC
jgi:hypothetical protein